MCQKRGFFLFVKIWRSDKSCQKLMYTNIKYLKLTIYVYYFLLTTTLMLMTQKISNAQICIFVFENKNIILRMDFRIHSEFKFHPIILHKAIQLNNSAYQETYHNLSAIQFYVCIDTIRNIW